MARETVLIDNCAWDILESRGVVLVDECGEDLQFTVSDLGLIEIPAGSHPSEDAQRVGKYARAQLAALEAEPAVWFQFRDINAPAPSGGGFGELQTDGSVTGGGFLTSVEGRAYADANEHRIGGASGVKRMGSGLLKHQTDIDYGEWSAGLLVITANPKDFKAGAKALDIRTWGAGSFGDFVRKALAER
ncbi:MULTISPECIES: hypothetical protein [Pseudomonas]|uniref:Uncharacterized protein n=1 Tax=Pseudomonas kuykendallii TaxID=1007099 RepID=A0A2W5CZP7_9PSED|nr:MULTISPECIES: hypothetical protein [Pseudomonas]MDA3395781.1 hypothetical protein [Pseudomonas aeruginosa]PZP21670.1 MAG: hypothetical protein DI599_18395 [Pseudomonas kuykendallii]TQI06910.1 hypothetical protein FLI94_29000 [Pseudomonas aeruginosa]HCT5750009.1 hypothetical protein [Pseudomonas aeruginosa]